MDEVIKFKDKYYILAHSSLADQQTRVLKHADTFGIFDRRGNIRPLGFEDHGIFYQGTRFVSKSEFKISGGTPHLLSSSIKEDNDFLTVDLTNQDFRDREGSFLHRGTIHIVRMIFLWEGCYFERMRIRNFGQKTVHFSISFHLDADYADIFEMRGMHRRKRGRLNGPRTGGRVLVLSYLGRDGKRRQTRFRFRPLPDRISGRELGFDIRLAKKKEKTVELACECSLDGRRPDKISLTNAFHNNKKFYEARRTKTCLIESSNGRFNAWLNQSLADLNMLLTETGHGLYPFAGIPWYSTVFGRDGIITALQTLWFYPEIAKGVLACLAAMQATKKIPAQDAEPGKILHETRKGEMAALKEIPFGRYYGTIDATPLFIVLAGAYYERTADKNFLKKLWPHIDAALKWIEQYGDLDGDGFVEYERHSGRGLFNQGWKDSEDAVFHADGRIADPPIALCEVQGYVYDAKLKASRLAAVLGNKKRAAALRREAELLRHRFVRSFWLEDLEMYALALDGHKRPCRVRSSNAGHCLFSGIANEKQAAKIAGRLTGNDFFSGWGIRTIPSSETRFNPMSYHNGSVWPHDNSMIAYGLARYGFKNKLLKILSGLFDASVFLDSHRLPELFCGFERREGEGPTLYPVACDPQAWASGAVFLLLQACLGLSIHAGENKVSFHKPSLPEFLKEVHIRNLRVGDSLLDIALERHENDVGVNVRRKTGNVDIVATK